MVLGSTIDFLLRSIIPIRGSAIMKRNFILSKRGHMPGRFGMRSCAIPLTSKTGCPWRVLWGEPMTLYRKELSTVKEIWNPDVARKLLRKFVRQKLWVHKRQAKDIAKKNYRTTLTCSGGQVGLDAINLDEQARRFSFKDGSSVTVRTAHGWWWWKAREILPPNVRIMSDMFHNLGGHPF